MIKIDQKISSVSIKDNSNPLELKEENKLLERPTELNGKTYKMSFPSHVSPHAFYITINDLVVNEGTDKEFIKPYEIFINSKDNVSTQWIQATTRVLSAVMRLSNDISFVCEEFKTISSETPFFSNQSLKKSIIAEIGEILDNHIYNLKNKTSNKSNEENNVNKISANKSLCNECGKLELVKESGCESCLNCGYSACG